MNANWHKLQQRILEKVAENVKVQVGAEAEAAKSRTSSSCANYRLMEVEKISRGAASVVGQLLQPEPSSKREPVKACWKTDLNNEACYIDVDLEDEVLGPDHQFSQWNQLPNLLLEEIYSYLDVRERYYASLVCRNWYSSFYLPRVWSMFLVDDHTLTRQRYNYYSGWQHTLDHLRTQYCLHRLGRHIKGLDFRPLHSFNNLFQFMTLVSWCIEQSRKPEPSAEFEGIGARISTLRYLFPCNMAAPDDPSGIKLFGTGGQLLAELKRLLKNLAMQLRNLQLTDLMLERYEAKHLLDEVLQHGQLVLRRLSLVNVTTVHCPIMHVGLFLNLQVLIISPQNIDDDLLVLFGDSRLRHLHILQNCYTPSHRRIEPCSARAWRTLKRDNPKLMVHLRVEELDGSSNSSNTTATTSSGDVSSEAVAAAAVAVAVAAGASGEFSEILWQPEAPVYSILYKTTANGQMTKTGSIIRAMDLYRSTLTIYGHEIHPSTTSSSTAPDNEVSGGRETGNWDEEPSKVPRASEDSTTTEVGLPKELSDLKLTEAQPWLSSEADEDDKVGDGKQFSQLQKFPTSAKVSPLPDFDNRIDSVAVLLARQTPNLSVLLLKDPVSTATLLLIARTAVNLRRFHVLREAVHIACDWPPNPEWTDEFYEWLCRASATISGTEREISQILDCNWQLLDRTAYERLDVNVRTV